MRPRSPATGLALVAAILAVAAAGAALPAGSLGLDFLANADVGNGRGIVADDGYVYAGGYDGLDVVDVSDPANPDVVGSTWVDGRDVELLHYDDGTTVAVLADQFGGMDFVDVTNPSYPYYIDSALTDGAVHNVGVAPGTHLVYAGPGTAGATETDGIAIVDASDPANPEVHRSNHSQLPCHDVEFDADRDLAFCPGITATEIWDVSDPRNPEVLAEIANPAINIHHWATSAGDGDVLVLGDEFAGAAADGCVARASTPDPAGDVSDPVGALWFYDIRNPRAPVLLSFLSAESVDGRLDGTLGESCTAHFGEVLPDGDALVAGWYTAGVKVVDVSNPLTPQVTDTYHQDGVNAWDARVEDGTVFTGDRNRGVDVLDLTTS